MCDITNVITPKVKVRTSKRPLKNYEEMLLTSSTSSKISTKATDTVLDRPQALTMKDVQPDPEVHQKGTQ